MTITVKPGYIEVGYIEIPAILKNFSGPGRSSTFSLLKNVGYIEVGYIEIPAILKQKFSPRDVFTRLY